MGLEKPQHKSATDFDIKDVKSGKVQVRLKNIDIRNGTNFFRCEIVGFSKASEFVDLMVAYFIQQFFCMGEYEFSFDTARLNFKMTKKS